MPLDAARCRSMPLMGNRGQPGFEGADTSKRLLVEPMIAAVRAFIQQFPA
jgi:hypothetical protein